MSDLKRSPLLHKCDVEPLPLNMFLTWRVDFFFLLLQQLPDGPFKAR